MAELHVKATLDRIVLGQGDTHNHGKSVAKLLFSDQSIYIYKPRELSIDVAFNDLLKKYNLWIDAGKELKAFDVISKKDFGIVRKAQPYIQPCSASCIIQIC